MAHTTGIALLSRSEKSTLKLWRNRASELLAELEPRDREARMESAQRLSRQPAFYQLFGVPDAAQGEVTNEEG